MTHEPTPVALLTIDAAMSKRKEKGLLNKKKLKNSEGGKLLIEKPLRCSLDSGSSDSIMVRQCAAKFKNVKSHKEKTQWKTAGGIHHTSESASVHFKLPDFLDSRKIKWKFHILDDQIHEMLDYDVIIGRDLLTEHGMKIDFKNYEVTCKKLKFLTQDFGELQHGKV